MAVITINSRSSFDEVCAEMDRRGAVIESLEAKLLAALSRAERAEASAAKMEAALRDVRHEIATQGLADTCGTYDRGVIARIDAALTTDGLALTGDAP